MRLERPHVTNHAVPALEGTLGVAEDGGTILTAEISYSFGWPRSHSHNVEDIDYVVRALARIAELARPKTSSPTGGGTLRTMRS